MLDLTEAWVSIQEMIDAFVASLPLIALALLVFGIFYLLGRWAKSVVRRVSDVAHLPEGAIKVLSRSARWLVMGVGLLISLNIAVPSFTTGEMIQFLGIGSVAVGFAFRDILQNFLAGILLLLTEPFHLGDQIVVSDYEGTVEDIETRATTIRTYDGRRVVIPNSSLFTESVTVNTAFAKRRSEYLVGIGFSDDVGRAMELILDVLNTTEGISQTPPPDVLISELGDFSVSIRARWWTKSRRSALLAVQSRVIVRIKERLTAEGIDLPFPTQQVLFHDQTEETDGYRSRQREGWPAGSGSEPRPRWVARSAEDGDGEDGF